MSKNKVSTETIVRLVVMVITLVNTILTMMGKNPLPWSEEEIYRFLTVVAQVAVTLWAWWKNNSFTSEAIEADKILNQLKENKK